MKAVTETLMDAANKKTVKDGIIAKDLVILPSLLTKK